MRILEVMKNRALFESTYRSDSLKWSIDVVSPPHPEYWKVNEWADNIRTRCYQHGDLVTDAAEVFCDVFGGSKAKDDVLTLFTPTGTMANRLGTTPMLNVSDAMVVSEIAHCVEREGGSVMAQSGSGLYTIRNGRTQITPEQLDQFLKYRFEKFVITQKPKIVSITCPMEDGTVCSLDDLRKLVEITHRYGMLFHLDGARIFLAAAHNNCSLREITTDLGVDILALGGSKSGMYKAEACVYLPPFFEKCGKNHLHPNATEMWNHLRSYLKRFGCLVGQATGVAAQFMRAFDDDFAIELGRHSNAMATEFGKQLAQLPGCSLARPVESNVVMLSVPKALQQHLDRRYHEVWVWQEEDFERPGNVLIRFMTNHLTTLDEIEETVGYLKEF